MPLYPPVNVVEGAIELITETVTTGSAGSVVFSAIPGTYRDLLVRVRGRGTTGAVREELRLQFNGDTGNNYNYEEFHYFGASGAGVQQTAVNHIFPGYLPAASATANYAGMMTITIGDYAGTTFFKATLSQHGVSTGTGGFSQGAGGGSGLWASTSAITSVTLFPASGNFVDGSVVSLYGSR